MMKKLNIAVIGWFNFLNAGDDRVGEVIIQLFDKHNVSLIKNYNRELLKTFDLIVFTAGTWHPRSEISRNFKRWHKFIKVPYMALGLGVEFTDDLLTKNNYNYFVENSLLTYVRDLDSKKALGNQEKVLVGPDITWMFPFSPIENYKPNKSIFLNLRPYSKLKDEIDKIAQYSNTKLEINNFYSLSPEDTSLGRKYNYEHIQEFHNKRILNDCSLMIGMRFHSSVFCQQFNIPHYNLVYHQKVGSLFKNEKSHINKMSNYLSFNQFKRELNLISVEDLLIEYKLLQTNRKEIVKKANYLKNIILMRLSDVKKNNYSMSLSFKLKNKIISYF